MVTGKDLYVPNILDSGQFDLLLELWKQVAKVYFQNAIWLVYTFPCKVQV